MKENRRLSLATLIVTIIFTLVPSIGIASDNALLTGSVKSASGEVVKGATVSAKAEGQTITTSVFTDDQGDFYFPPTLPNGKYEVWAQTVGYETGRSQVVLADNLQRNNFVLKPIKDMSAQFSSMDFFTSLPGDTPQHRRMKEVLFTNCTGCHPVSLALQNRFDEKGWTVMIDLMSRIDNFAVVGRKDEAPQPSMQYFKKELAAYLAEMRGPGPSPMQIKPHRPPTGDAARAVFVEYALPGPHRSAFTTPEGYTVDDGSDWSFGTPSMINGGRDVHDTTLDLNGNIWFASTLSPQRTVGMVDAKTGKITDIVVPGPNGKPESSHGMTTDSKGKVWFTLSRGGAAKVDPNTMQVEAFPYKGGSGGAIDVDAKGYVWIETNRGAIRLDPGSHAWTAYTSAVLGSRPDAQTPEGAANSYGVAVDREGSGWWTVINLDRVDRVDMKTGKSVEITIPEAENEVTNLFTADDRKMMALARQNNQVSRPGARTPRRLGADKNGDTVWVCDFFGGDLVKINTTTMKVVLYPVPVRESNPYDAVVDMDHNVWVDLMNGDQVLKFDPKTEKWTEYTLPTLGAETRHLSVSTYDRKMHISLGYVRMNKAARMDFRTAEEMQALKKQVQQQAGLR